MAEVTVNIEATEMTSKIGQILKAAQGRIARCLKATAIHVGTLFRLCKALVGRHRARSLVRECEIELGRMLAKADSGPKELLQQIKLVEERIASVQRAEASTKQLEIERQGLFRRLATWDVPNDAADDVKAASQATSAARERLREADDSVQSLGVRAMPSSDRPLGQLGLGYGLVTGLIASLFTVIGPDNPQVFQRRNGDNLSVHHNSSADSLPADSSAEGTFGEVKDGVALPDNNDKKPNAANALDEPRDVVKQERPLPKSPSEQRGPATKQAVRPPETIKVYDLVTEMQKAGFEKQTSSSNVEGFVRYGSKDLFDKARRGDQFDRIESRDAAAKHRDRLSQQAFRIHAPLRVPRRNDFDSKGLVVTAAIPAKLWRTKSDWVSKGGQLLLSWADMSQWWYLTKEGNLRRCPNQFEFEAVKKNNGVLYVPRFSVGKIDLSMSLTLDLETSKLISRNAAAYHVEAIVRRLVFEDAGFEWGYFRYDELIARDWDCEGIILSSEFEAGDAPQPVYFRPSNVKKEMVFADLLAVYLKESSSGKVLAEFRSSEDRTVFDLSELPSK